MKSKFILLSASAMMIMGNSIAQSYVTSGGAKYPLLEEGTGTWCGYCPDGSQRIQEAIEPVYPRCVAVAFHNGGSDAMTLPGDPFNSVYISGFPGAAIDRLVWTHGSTTSVGVNRGYWATDVGVQNGKPANFDVRMVSTYDSTTRILTVKVIGKALAAMTGNYRINAYVVEDSISSSGSGYAQGSYMNGDATSWYYGYGSPITPASRYAHMGVVRKILASGGSIYGDVAFANPAVNDSVTKTYIDTIPSTYNAKHMKVVGIVQKYGTTTNDRGIENVISAKVKLMLKMIPSALTEISQAMEDVELFPNPATGFITVKGMLSAPTETRIVITNTVGQIVSENVYPAGGSIFAENISLNNLVDGMYFMNIANNGASVTKKFVVSK